MKTKFALIVLTLGVFFSSSNDLKAEGWSWNPINAVTQPNWFTKSVSATGTAVKKTTTGTWNAVSKGTATVWHKTTDWLDPYPNKPDKTTSAKSSFDGKPATAQEFLNQDRPAY